MSKLKVKRNAEMMELINSGISYEEIGKLTVVTKQRVYQIALRNGHSRWDNIRANKELLIKTVNSDIKNDLTYKEIVKKHGKKKIEEVYNKASEVALHDYFRKIRNRVIRDLFSSGKAASDIIKMDDKSLLSPIKIDNVNGVYRINKTQNIRRHPKVGDRNAGSTFEDKKLLNYIVEKHDKDNWSFVKITKVLNELGHRTVTGVLFAYPNVIAKYHYHKNKTKQK